MTLGNVGKASVDQFAGARKLLLVPLVPVPQDSPKLRELAERYWNEVGQQVRQLEMGLGKVSYVFHEGSADEDDAALAALEQANPAAVPFLRELWLRGAQLRPIEDVETLLEVLDLHRLLLLGQASATVGRRLLEWYADARKRRYELMGKRIDEALGEDQMGLLVIGQDHQLQFPPDVQVFYVAPPVLNDLQQRLRDQLNQGADQDSQDSADPGDQAADGNVSQES